MFAIIPFYVNSFDLLYIFIPTGAEIGFEKVSYSSGESAQSVRVCVVSSVELERTVSVDLVIRSGSAESEYSTW